jgi:hypothetical protein
MKPKEIHLKSPFIGREEELKILEEIGYQTN